MMDHIESVEPSGVPNENQPIAQQIGLARVDAFSDYNRMRPGHNYYRQQFLCPATLSPFGFYEPQYQIWSVDRNLRLPSTNEGLEAIKDELTRRAKQAFIDFPRTWDSRGLITYHGFSPYKLGNCAVAGQWQRNQCGGDWGLDFFQFDTPAADAYWDIPLLMSSTYRTSLAAVRDLIRGLAGRAASDIVLEARRDMVLRLAKQIEVLGGFDAALSQFARSSAVASAQRHRADPTVDAVASSIMAISASATAAGPAGAWVALAGAIVGGTMMLVNAAVDHPVSVKMDEFGRFKPWIDTPYIGGTPTSPPVFDVPSPPGWRRTSIQLNPAILSAVLGNTQNRAPIQLAPIAVSNIQAVLDAGARARELALQQAASNNGALDVTQEDRPSVFARHPMLAPGLVLLGAGALGTGAWWLAKKHRERR
jgi:hypothetical protein